MFRKLMSKIPGVPPEIAYPVPKPNDPPQGTQEQLSIAQHYMNNRLSGNNDACLSLVADNIHFVSQRDGTVIGRHDFAKYLARTPIEGNWSPPVVSQQDSGLVRINGQVTFMGIWVNVKSIFKFDSNNRIAELAIGRA